jgi:hypothetical protein
VDHFSQHPYHGRHRAASETQISNIPDFPVPDFPDIGEGVFYLSFWKEEDSVTTEFKFPPFNIE